MNFGHSSQMPLSLRQRLFQMPPFLVATERNLGDPALPMPNCGKVQQGFVIVVRLDEAKRKKFGRRAGLLSAR